MPPVSRRWDRENFKCYCVPILMALFITFIVLSILFFKTLPSVQLVSISATPLISASAATWNLSLQLSSPSAVFTISYDQFHVSMFYMDNYSYDNSKSHLIDETVLEPIVGQKGRAKKMLYPLLPVSTDTVGENLIKKIVEDQSRGLVRVRIRVSFRRNFRDYSPQQEVMRFLCNDLNIVFDNGGLGFASDVPKMCKFVSKAQYYSNYN